MHEKTLPHAYKDMNILQLLMYLPREISMLLKSEIRLFKTEMGAKAGDAAKSAVLVAIGGFILYLASLAAVATLIIVIGKLIPLWASALIIALALLTGGGIIVFTGISKLKKLDWVPNKTIETVKENFQWLRTRTA